MELTRIIWVIVTASVTSLDETISPGVNPQNGSRRSGVGRNALEYHRPFA